MKNFTIATVVGIICGFLSAHSLFPHSYTAIIFWGFVGLIVGVIVSREDVKISGLSYGFFLILSFLLFGFQGTTDKLLGFIIFSLVLSIVGALCGWLAVFVGNRLRLLFKSK